jgi:hypothetical protein
MVMMSALGRGSAKKSPEAAPTRSASPVSAMCLSAIGATTGRS